MKRRTFLKISAASSAATMIPFSLRSYAAKLAKGLSSRASLDIKVSSQQAKICNNKIRKVMLFSDQKAMPIQVASLFDRNGHKELLAEAQPPWFEFVINERLIKSSDSLWKYDNHNVVGLDNGGKELRLVFAGAISDLKGLRITLKQQVFPDSSLIREQLILNALPGKKFSMNRINKKLHFVFPAYNLKANDSARLTSTEFRVATWDKEILDDIDSSSYDSRQWDEAGDLNLAMAHMFHPDIILIAI